MLRNSLLPALVLAAAGGSGPAPRSAAATISAVAVPQATAIKLDGTFGERIWDAIPAVTDFRQREPKDGGPPTFQTEVKVAYDAANLYVAVRARDPEPGKLVGLRTRRDSSSPSD